MKTFIPLILALFFSISANSYTSTSGSNVQIQDLRTYSADFVLFKSSAARNSDNCDGQGEWIYLPQNTEAQKRIFTVLLSARVSNQPVTLFFNGCHGGGTSGWRLLEQILL